MTPLRSIRAKCLECSGGSWNEVDLCAIDDCALYAYRFGKRPTHPIPAPVMRKGRPLSPEHLAKLQAGLKARRRQDRPVESIP